MIQLVPVAAPTPQPEITEAIKKPESSAIEAEIPLQLPRAMRSAASNSNLLRERNSEQSDVSVVNKDGSGAPAPTSPPRRQRMTDEKENRGL